MFNLYNSMAEENKNNKIYTIEDVLMKLIDIKNDDIYPLLPLTTMTTKWSSLEVSLPKLGATFSNC